MNRTFSKPLTPSLARTMIRFAEFTEMPIPDEFLDMAEKDRLNFDDYGVRLTERQEDAAQFIVDMNYRCSIIDRSAARGHLIQIVAAAFVLGGITKYVMDCQRCLIPNVKGVTLPTELPELAAIRDHVLIKDLDGMFPTKQQEVFVARMFPKTILMGSKIYQYSFGNEGDVIERAAAIINPGMMEAIGKKSMKKIGFKKLITGMYPYSITDLSLADPVDAIEDVLNDYN